MPNYFRYGNRRLRVKNKWTKTVFVQLDMLTTIAYVMVKPGETADLLDFFGHYPGSCWYTLRIRPAEPVYTRAKNGQPGKRVDKFQPGVGRMVLAPIGGALLGAGLGVLTVVLCVPPVGTLTIGGVGGGAGAVAGGVGGAATAGGAPAIKATVVSAGSYSTAATVADTTAGVAVTTSPLTALSLAELSHTAAPVV
jgi:hypothetical protein